MCSRGLNALALEQALDPPDPSHAFESATATVDSGEAADDVGLAIAALRLLEDIVGTHWQGSAMAPPSAGGWHRP